jgi:hypothetical protein
MEGNMEEVSIMVGNLRNMAIDMGSEIGNQNNQIDRINLMVRKSSRNCRLDSAENVDLNLDIGCLQLLTNRSLHNRLLCENNVRAHAILTSFDAFLVKGKHSLTLMTLTHLHEVSHILRFQAASNEVRISMANERANKLLK